MKRDLIADLKSILNIKRAFKDDEVRFRLITTLKIFGVPFFTFVVTIFLIWFMAKMNLIFFKANGYEKLPEFESLFYDYITMSLLDYWWILLLFFIALIFVGLYIADLLLRPFRIIGEYCDKFVNEDKIEPYDPDFFTDLKLLSHFSEWFFNSVESFYKNGTSIKLEVPKKFTRIHKPVFENSFFLHYSIVIILTSICAIVISQIVAVEVYSEMIDLAGKTLSSQKSIAEFLGSQKELYLNAQVFVICIHLLLSVYLIFHLYGKVAGASFGFFATMRSYIKGNYDSRVHLVGYYYIRNYSRKLNKYLDKVKKEIVEKSNQGDG